MKALSISNILSVLIQLLIANIGYAQVNEASPSTEASSQAELTAPVSAPANDSILAFGGSAYLALENWGRVGASGDSKMGFGFGGEFGIGTRIDEMKVLVGPHFGFNRWAADYSQKYQSATDSVYVEMMDVGLMLMTDFGDMYLNIGAGSSEISSGMIVDGKDIKYNYNGSSYSYNNFSIGTNLDRMLLGVGVVNYSGYAKYADRVEFLLGYVF